jgi:uncharacterized protein
VKRATEKTIREMASVIAQKVRPAKVILFGSHARGTAGPFSDVDFLVVEKQGFGPRHSRRGEMVRISKSLSPYRVPTDILVYSLDEFEYWSDSPNHVVGRAVQEGRVLYERP